MCSKFLRIFSETTFLKLLSFGNIVLINSTHMWMVVKLIQCTLCWNLHCNNLYINIIFVRGAVGVLYWNKVSLIVGWRLTAIYCSKHSFTVVSPFYTLNSCWTKGYFPTFRTFMGANICHVSAECVCVCACTWRLKSERIRFSTSSSISRFWL